MVRANNLRCRNGSFLFRRKIPCGIARRIAIHEMALSLGTRDPTVARRRAHMAWICTEALFSAVDRAPTPISFAEIKARVRAQLDKWIEAGEASLACGETMAGLWPGAPDDRAYSNLADSARNALARNDLAQAAAVVASGGVTGIVPETLDERTEKLVCHAVLRAQHEFWTEIHRRSEGDYPPLARSAADPSPTDRPPLTTDQLASAPGAAAPAPGQLQSQAPGIERLPELPCPPLTQDGQEFGDAMVREKKWTKHTRKQADATLRMWREVQGDLPANMITKEHASRFRILLTRLPCDYSKARRWRGMTLAAIADAADVADAAAEALTPDTPDIEDRLALKTVERHMTAVASKWSWLVTNGRGRIPTAATNPFHGFGSGRKSREEIAEERLMWSTEQLQMLFITPVWTGCHSLARRTKPGKHIFRDGRFWIPLIAAFSMLRLEEIAQQCVEDIVLYEGIWSFRIAKVIPTRAQRRAGTKRRRIKTPSSWRYVPIHRTLLDIGILDLIKDRPNASERLFPELLPGGADRRFGFYLTKWFTAYRRQVGCYWADVDIHSLRHVGTTLLVNAGVPEAWIDELSGHESRARRTETSRYTKTIWHANLKAAIDKLDLGVDFSHLLQKPTNG
ncbi:MAG: site-specific integrase [Pseudomonadota bacterium]